MADDLAGARFGFARESGSDWWVVSVQRRDGVVVRRQLGRCSSMSIEAARVAGRVAVRQILAAAGGAELKAGRDGGGVVLTETLVTEAEGPGPGEAYRFTWDAQVVGLGLRVGRRSAHYLVQTQGPDGRQVRRVFGRAGVMPLAAARKIAASQLLAIRQGSAVLSR